MPKFLVHASYRTEGVRGLLKDGGTGRKVAVEKAVQSVGGRLEAVYFTFGDDDVIVLADFPSNTAAAAFSLAVNAYGLTQARITVLLTAEEIDQAAGQSVDYRGPGA